jgi:hypothetical protein
MILKKVEKIFLILVLLFCSNFNLFSAFDGNRYKSQNTRARGLGNSYTALANDSGAFLYNLAGLAKVNYYDLYFLYTDLYSDLEGVDLYSGYTSFIFPINNIGTFGVNYNKFQGDDLYYEDIISLGYGKRFFNKLSLGLGVSFLKHGYEVKYGENIKYIDPTFENGTEADNYGVNLGLLYDYNKYLSLGLSANNINRPDVGLKDKDIVPEDYRFGVAFKYNSLAIPIDISYRRQDWGTDKDNKITKSIGFEKWFSEVFAARAGLNDYEYSVGFSLVKPNLFKKVDTGLEYSFSFPRYLEDNFGSHQLSIFFRFGNSQNFEKEKNREFYDYQSLHPKFSIKQGVSSNSENVSELFFDGVIIYKFKDIVDNKDTYTQALDLAKKLSILMKTEIVKDTDLKIEKETENYYINIKNMLKIPVFKEKNISLPKYELNVNALFNKLKYILVFSENLNSEVKNIGKNIKVVKGITAAGEVGVIYLNDKQVFTIYSNSKKGKTSFEVAIDFANFINKYLSFDKKSLNIYSDRAYGEEYIYFNYQEVLNINKEAEFLGITPEILSKEYIKRLKFIFGIE